MLFLSHFFVVYEHGPWATRRKERERCTWPNLRSIWIKNGSILFRSKQFLILVDLRISPFWYYQKTTIYDREEILKKSKKNIFLREWSFLRNYCRLVQKLIGAKKITKYYLLLLNFGTRLGIVSIQSARSKVNGPKWAIRSGRFFIPLKKTDWNPSKSNILFLLIPPIMMVKFKQYGKVMDMPVNIVWEWVLNALNNLCQSFSKTLF